MLLLWLERGSLRMGCIAYLTYVINTQAKSKGIQNVFLDEIQGLLSIERSISSWFQHWYSTNPFTPYKRTLTKLRES